MSVKQSEINNQQECQCNVLFLINFFSAHETWIAYIFSFLSSTLMLAVHLKGTALIISKVEV